MKITSPATGGYCPHKSAGRATPDLPELQQGADVISPRSGGDSWGVTASCPHLPSWHSTRPAGHSNVFLAVRRFVVSGKEWGALSGWGMGGAQGVNLGWHSWIQRKPSIQGPPVLGWEQKPVLLPKPWGAVCGPGALESGRGWCCLWCFSWTSLRTSPRSPTHGKHVPNMWNRSGLLTHQGLGMGLSWGCTVWRSGKGCPTQIMKLFSCRSC